MNACWRSGNTQAQDFSARFTTGLEDALQARPAAEVPGFANHGPELAALGPPSGHMGWLWRLSANPVPDAIELERSTNEGGRMNTSRTAALVALGVALSALLGGCGSLKTPEERSTLFDRNGTDLVIDHQNGISHTFKSANDTDKGCRSPSPDIVTGSSSAFSESIPIKLLGSEQAGASRQFDTAMLGGRSPSVLISREILFRGCELASNHALSTEQVLALFRDSLDKIALIVQTTKQETGTPPGSTGGAASAVLPPSTAPLPSLVPASDPTVPTTAPSVDPVSPTEATGDSTP